MLMGFILSFVMLCCLCSLKGIHCMDNSTLRSLDDLFLEYAENSLPTRPRTGVLYNASLPQNFTDVKVSIIRLRRDSFWSKGANYSGFYMPPKIFSMPNFTRLDMVYSNLGNLSSYYYNVPNYTLVAPVVGFNAYGSRNSTGQIGNLTTPMTRLNLTLFGGPILVQFPDFSLPQNGKAKCAVFHLNGTVEMTNMTLQNMCIVQDQGHFSIVVPQPPPVPWAPKKKKEREELWKWWVFGFAIGVLGLLLCGFIIFMIVRVFRMRKIEKMEKEAEKNEPLDATNVGQSRMPLASAVRTQPIIENDYHP
ncbi:hypothetical protein L2E82_45981 [Cichorium intybus]|uniref:Uncharacterized protein n=1 Tax=Cichorium intybus TaxID=13427 RepID=A0ACB8ZU20_CICIN|nr:hypothetical protein L2E82_45981 [Cichorium intybus]